MPKDWKPRGAEEQVFWQELRTLAEAAETMPECPPQRGTVLESVESELVSVFPDQPCVAWSASKVRDDIGILQWPEGVPRTYHLFAFGGTRRSEMRADALTKEVACTLTQMIGLPKGWVWAVNLLGHSYVFDATQPEQTLRTAVWHRGTPTAWTRSVNGRYAASAKVPYAVLTLAVEQEGAFISGDTWGWVRAVDAEHGDERCVDNMRRQSPWCFLCPNGR